MGEGSHDVVDMDMGVVTAGAEGAKRSPAFVGIESCTLELDAALDGRAVRSAARLWDTDRDPGRDPDPDPPDICDMCERIDRRLLCERTGQPAPLPAPLPVPLLLAPPPP